MSNPKPQHNTECASKMHRAHLCSLMYEGFHLKNPQEYKKMVQDAKYRCDRCGRTAHDEADLCQPIEL